MLTTQQCSINQPLFIHDNRNLLHKPKTCFCHCCGCYCLLVVNAVVVVVVVAAVAIAADVI